MSIPNLKSCIVFSCFKNIKPSWKEPYISTTIFKPFKFFYVNFPLEDYDSNNPCKYNYLTNEKLFLKKLEEWGVRIEGINDPPKPYENKKEKWF